ncbi:hypothetical protein LH935_28310 (plasmid) [Gordonia polyisoprenivorans]|uniref:hypothetical protein n=1 Tax=Gordonia polyisoprenivorans TaxID=84595 RepID=UPI002234CB0E|nr:hypothetical protein LH935_28310 [Gordonia polyisoprenivorans]
MTHHPDTETDASDNDDTTPSPLSADVGEAMTATDPHSDLEGIAVFGEDLGEITETLTLEFELLTALVWAPDPVTRDVVTALVGDAVTRDRTHGRPDTAIPLSHTLFLSTGHTILFTTIVAMIDEGMPVTPTLLLARLRDTGHHRTVAALLPDLAAPRGHTPLPGGIDTPHLAAALVDAWYRRGYTALLARMTHATTTEPTDTLAGHWSTLTTHAAAAERRWLTIRDTLAGL